MQKQKTIRSAKHRAFIRTLPCVVCGGPSEAAHIRRGTDGGMGMKPSDSYTVPLCPHHHREQHNIGELRFWYPYSGWEAAKALGKQLYAVTGDREKSIDLILRFKSRVK